MRASRGLALAVVLGSSLPAAWATNGHFLHGAGPVNQAMGGAGIAGFLDPIGVARWNPAGMVRLEGNGGMEFGVENFHPDRSVKSSISANAFGAGQPGQALSGETDSAVSAALLPSFGWFKKLGEGQDRAVHMALIGVAGFGVDYPLDATNPILSPSPPGGFGFGGVKSEYQLLKLVMGYSRQMDDRLSVGVGLVPALSRLMVTPAPFAAPDDANGDGFRSYPGASHMESALGVGFQVGASYTIPRGWTFGFAYHGPIHFDDFEWQVQDELGRPRQIDFDLDLPATVGIGVSRKANEKETFALDLRYIPYQRTEGFRQEGFDAAGRVKGFGWEDTWVVGAGYQRKLDDRWTMRAGYNYNQNPVPDEVAFFNVPAPAVVEHRVSFGATQQLRRGHALHMAYYHGFENLHQGKFFGPTGSPVPGTTVENHLSEDSISLAYARRW